MTARRVVVIQGHPDPSPDRLCRALGAAYADGAGKAGHSVRHIDVAALDFPMLTTKAEFDTGDPPPDIADAQAAVKWAEHMVFIYPLWLGTMPALLKAFLERVFAHGIEPDHDTGTGKWPFKLLAGRSARIVVTMGMPAFIYRWFFWAHSLKSFERCILRMVGIKPVRETLIGGVGEMDRRKAEKHLGKIAELGRKAL